MTDQEQILETQKWAIFEVRFPAEIDDYVKRFMQKYVYLE